MKIMAIVGPKEMRNQVEKIFTTGPLINRIDLFDSYAELLAAIKEESYPLASVAICIPEADITQIQKEVKQYKTGVKIFSAGNKIR